MLIAEFKYDGTELDGKIYDGPYNNVEIEDFDSLQKALNLGNGEFCEMYSACDKEYDSERNKSNDHYTNGTHIDNLEIDGVYCAIEVKIKYIYTREWNGFGFELNAPPKCEYCNYSDDLAKHVGVFNYLIKMTNCCEKQREDIKKTWFVLGHKINW